MDWADTEKRALREALAEIRDALAERERECTELRHKLAESTRVLSETNHRIVNGLHLATVFLRLQEQRLGEGTAKDAIRAAGGRIEAMVHFNRQICLQGNSDWIDFAQFLTNFVLEIGESTGLSCSIKATTCAVDGKTAADMAIVVNELLTNAAKHAYGGTTVGRIDIDCRREDNGAFVLGVRDYGPGFPDGYRARATSSLGMTLVRSIVEEHHGTLEIANDRGARITVTIPPPAN